MTAPHPAPNPRLIETVSHLSPGQALELGCGNGGDAIWLAENRWTVTAVDISTAATDRLTHLADETGLKDRITAIPWDLTRGLPEGEFDLVNTHYLHTHSPLDRVTVFRAAAGALRPGGHLLIVDHGSTAPWSWNQDPSPPRSRCTRRSRWSLPVGSWSERKHCSDSRLDRAAKGPTSLTTF